MANRNQATGTRTTKTETAWKFVRVHPVLKVMLVVCLAIPTAAVILMTVGAWDVKGDSLDGALRATAIISGIVGICITFVIDRQ